jgi:cholesterol oxidase
MTLGGDSYEAIVVGSGFGGAVAACRLAQAGVDVAVLERGRRFPLGSFPRHRLRPDLQDWRRGGTYDVRYLNDVLVVQGAGYGGGSLLYANVQIRPPADVFDEGWPAGYSRAALDPYYDLVGYMLDIAPIAEERATGELPPKTRLMEAAAGRLGREAQTFRPNLAVRFEGAGEDPVPNKFGALQSGCVHCGECDIGCNVGAKNTLDLNYLAVAERFGAQVATESEVAWLAPEGEGFRLRYCDLAGDGGEHTVAARQVFLCLGAVNTTELLLRCRDQHRTLPHLSPRLGSGYSANGDFLAFGLGTSPPFETTNGPTITTASVYDEQHDGRRHRLMVQDGGYSPQLSHLMPLMSPSRLTQLVGRELANRVGRQTRTFASLREEEGDKTAVLLAMGRDSADGTIELRRPGHRLRVRWDTPRNLGLYAAETAACRELATELGGRLALAPNWRFLGQPSAPHNLGGCRMAASAADGVVDGDGRVFGYPGLHVLDSAIVPGAVGVNPSHTIAAVAERCIEAAIRRRPGRERWAAPEAAHAPRLAPPEDRVTIPDGGTPPLSISAGGVRWHERLQGTVRDSTTARRASFEVTISVPDVSSFVADPAHPGAAAGTVHVEGLTGPTGAPIEAGSFHLFVDEGDPRARTMAYALPFCATDGRRWVLRGTKDVRGRRILDFWRATTTLDARVEPTEGDGAPATGQLRLGPPAVARLMTSIRPVRGSRRTDPALALARFGAFFAATLARLYVAGRRG